MVEKITANPEPANPVEAVEEAGEVLKVGPSAWGSGVGLRVLG